MLDTEVVLGARLDRGVAPAVQHEQRVAAEEISAATDPWTRLVRALVHDYEVIRMDGERYAKYTVKRALLRADLKVDASLRTPAELWERLYKSYENIAYRLTGPEMRAAAAWFAREATARGVQPDATVPWPQEPKRSMLGKVKTQDGRAWGPVVYDTGAPTPVWRVPQSVHANHGTVIPGDTLIAADGRLHVASVLEGKTVKTDFDFDVITLIWLGGRLGMPVGAASAKILQAMTKGGAPSRY